VGTELIALVKVGGKDAYAAARPRTFAERTITKLLNKCSSLSARPQKGPSTLSFGFRKVQFLTRTQPYLFGKMG